MSSLAPFLRKLWAMVNDESNHSVIQWLEDGDGFIILKPKDMGTLVLPKYYNGNMCSFVRQLNLYGFNKIGDEFVFKHNGGHFKQGQEDKLIQIERRKNIKTRNRNETHSTGKKQKAHSTQTPNPPQEASPPAPEETLAKLIVSNNTHELMINLLVKELQLQQRESALLKEQITSLTSIVGTLTSGTYLPDPGNNGTIHPNSGTIMHPNSGPMHQNSGTMHSNSGPIHPNSGTMHSNSANMHPNSGNMHSNQGNIHSNPGNIHPNPVTFRQDSGTTGLRPDAVMINYSQNGSQLQIQYPAGNYQQYYQAVPATKQEYFSLSELHQSLSADHIQDDTDDFFDFLQEGTAKDHY